MVSPNTSPQQQQPNREGGDEDEEDSNEHFEDSIEHVDEDNANETDISKRNSSSCIPSNSIIRSSWITT